MPTAKTGRLPRAHPAPKARPDPLAMPRDPASSPLAISFVPGNKRDTLISAPCICAIFNLMAQSSKPSRAKSSTPHGASADAPKSKPASRTRPERLPQSHGGLRRVQTNARSATNRSRRHVSRKLRPRRLQGNQRFPDRRRARKAGRPGKCGVSRVSFSPRNYRTKPIDSAKRFLSLRFRRQIHNAVAAKARPRFSPPWSDAGSHVAHPHKIVDTSVCQLYY